MVFTSSTVTLAVPVLMDPVRKPVARRSIALFGNCERLYSGRGITRPTFSCHSSSLSSLRTSLPASTKVSSSATISILLLVYLHFDRAGVAVPLDYGHRRLEAETERLASFDTQEWMHRSRRVRRRPHDDVVC